MADCPTARLGRGDAILHYSAPFTTFTSRFQFTSRLAGFARAALHSASLCHQPRSLRTALTGAAPCRRQEIPLRLARCPVELMPAATSIACVCGDHQSNRISPANRRAPLQPVHPSSPMWTKQALRRAFDTAEHGQPVPVYHDARVFKADDATTAAAPRSSLTGSRLGLRGGIVSCDLARLATPAVIAPLQQSHPRTASADAPLLFVAGGMRHV
jgi:hypothetical protein